MFSSQVLQWFRGFLFASPAIPDGTRFGCGPSPAGSPWGRLPPLRNLGAAAGAAICGTGADAVHGRQGPAADGIEMYQGEDQRFFSGFFLGIFG